MSFASERARRLRASTRVLEAFVWLIVAGLVAAIVHPRRPRLRSGPLFWPGLAFLLWVIVPLAPLLRRCVSE